MIKKILKVNKQQVMWWYYVTTRSEFEDEKMYNQKILSKKKKTWGHICLEIKKRSYIIKKLRYKKKSIYKQYNFLKVKYR